MNIKDFSVVVICCYKSPVMESLDLKEYYFYNARARMNPSLIWFEIW